MEIRGVAVSQLALLPVGNACSHLSAGLIIIGLFDKNAACRALIKRAGFAAGADGRGEKGDTWHLIDTAPAFVPVQQPAHQISTDNILAVEVGIAHPDKLSKKCWQLTISTKKYSKLPLFVRTAQNQHI